ncbi:MAG: hypothetical protein KBT75_17885, partial [Oleispira antarctica]|nr:hypothetical protein [Oleispira antarctica]
LKNNKAVAHYGLCDRNALYNDRVFGFAQASDVMVAPAERGAISSSIFYELVQLGEKPFYASDSNISVIYGFPHGKHYKLGARLKLYEPVSPIFEVVFDIPDGSKSEKLASTSIEVELVKLNVDSKAGIEHLWKSMTFSANVLLLERSYLYLLQRYAFHPEYEYSIYHFESCYFVIKVSGDKIFLMDYLGLIESYADNLVLFISFLSRISLGRKLHLWCLEDISTLFIEPIQIMDTGAVFVCKKYSSDLPDLKRWWITMGDTEFL